MPWTYLNTRLKSPNTSIRVVSNPKIQASYSTILFVAGCWSENPKRTNLGMWSPWGDINKTLVPYPEWLVAPNEENIAIYQRYIGDISWSKGIDTIFHGEISVRQYFGINPEKSIISRNISVILVTNRWFLVKRTTVKSMCYSAL